MHIPSHDCPLCPRLAAYRSSARAEFPDWFNGPVPAFGTLDARVLIVGLAPGLRGANRTGRPFTGDYAGNTLYAALIKHGFAAGQYDQRPDDDLVLRDCRISNAVKCVPPENKPTPQEITTCLPFLRSEVAAMPNLKVILALGSIAHQASLRMMGLRASAAKFAHGAEHRLPAQADGRRPVILLDSYHCSRYNTNTGRLTEAMFDAVVARLRVLAG